MRLLPSPEVARPTSPPGTSCHSSCRGAIGGGSGGCQCCLGLRYWLPTLVVYDNRPPFGGGSAPLCWLMSARPASLAGLSRLVSTIERYMYLGVVVVVLKVPAVAWEVVRPSSCSCCCCCYLTDPPPPLARLPSLPIPFDSHLPATSLLLSTYLPASQFWWLPFDAQFLVIVAIDSPGDKPFLLFCDC